MVPTVSIFTYEVSTYGIIALVGMICAVSYCLWQAKKYHLVIDDMVNMLAYACIGGVIGAKLLYLLTTLEEIWENQAIIFSSIETFTTYFFSGFVFYGGFIGAVIGALLYGKQFKVDILDYVKIALPALPLFHAFGRIGCFLVGCCYGIESTSFIAVDYHTPFAHDMDAMRIPVQLLEACCNIMLCIVLHFYTKMHQTSYKSVSLYLIIYVITRFLLEFLRGDEARGIWLLSTSQWISICLLVSGIYFMKYEAQVIHRLRKMMNK